MNIINTAQPQQIILYTLTILHHKINAWVLLLTNCGLIVVNKPFNY